MGAPFSEALKRCSKCLLPETHETLVLDEQGVCNVCRGQEIRAQINWDERLGELTGWSRSIAVDTDTTA